MAKYDREAVIDRLVEKRGKHVTALALAEQHQIDVFETWKAAAVKDTEQHIENQKRTLVAAKRMKFGPKQPWEPDGHHGGEYRPSPLSDSKRQDYLDKIEAVDRAIAELELMVDAAVSLTSSHIIKLL